MHHWRAPRRWKDGSVAHRLAKSRHLHHCWQGVWRSAGSSTPPRGVDAGLPTADMPIFAQSADAHTLWLSVAGRSVKTGQGPLTRPLPSCPHRQNELLDVSSLGLNIRAYI